MHSYAALVVQHESCIYIVVLLVLQNIVLLHSGSVVKELFPQEWRNVWRWNQMSSSVGCLSDGEACAHKNPTEELYKLCFVAL